MKSEEFIKCFVRIKPSERNEPSALGSSESEVRVNKTRETFSFNRVFNENTQNDTIYIQAVSPVISDVLKGYNACVLAYGQTSSGKTYTMKGVSTNLGLIPLSIQEIFGQIQQKGMVANVKISYFQIYNENIIDLLIGDDQIKFLDLREDGHKNLIIVNLVEQEVKNELEALQFYQQGERKRKYASNTSNINSSRSHTIFRVTLFNVNEENQLIQSSIYMVDLAGSESISKTNAVGVLKKEAENINKSLLALTTAIRAISEKQAYVNYRNSKLTRILQPCLSGKSKTIVICTVNRTEDSLSETVNTLKFGASARTIRTDVQLNLVENKIDSRFQDLKQLLEEERRSKDYLESEMVRKNGEIQIKNLRIDELKRDLDECKHRLIALEGENRHHADIINIYKTQEEQGNQTRNIFFQRTKESIALIEAENRQLKITIRTQDETIQNRNKKIAMLEKNERTLLDKIEKYEKELRKIQEMADSRENPQEKARDNQPIRNQPQKIINRNRGQPQMISNPLTIGTCIKLSTTILSLRIDMNHYLNTISDLHTEINELQAKIDELEQAREAKLATEQSKLKRQSVGKAKDDDKKLRKLECKVQELRKIISKLQKKNTHNMKILKKCANNNINSITGFNDYIAKHFKLEKQQFEELFQQAAQDFEPYPAQPPLRRNRDDQQ